MGLSLTAKKQAPATIISDIPTAASSGVFPSPTSAHRYLPDASGCRVIEGPTASCNAALARSRSLRLSQPVEPGHRRSGEQSDGEASLRECFGNAGSSVWLIGARGLDMHDGVSKLAQKSEVLERGASRTESHPGELESSGLILLLDRRALILEPQDGVGALRHFSGDHVCGPITCGRSIDVNVLGKLIDEGLCRCCGEHDGRD